ncbi:DUF308 domain-containing protein [Isoptericola sp. b441]|uniref:DUF308 domain-containing protein n=1 Tax=Actinotalea lenta TaxID=3064654 RepID=A0ABT9D6C3_9CELL|nr:DUF308 domain-containing protein [Isoptericola sp. b441]MDO8106384.1 DUF308 domain-containing protein [Isoptericola sp. b441]
MTSDAAALRSVAAITWVPLVAVGVLVAAAGGLLLAAPEATVTLLTVAVALWLLITGLGRIALGMAVASWSGPRRGVTVLTGVVLAVAGVAALLNISGSTDVLGWAIGIGLLLGAAGDVAVLVSGRARRSRTTLVVLAVAQLALGVVFLLEPGVGLVGIAVALGGTLVAVGVVGVVAGVVVRRRVNRFVDRWAAGSAGPDQDQQGPEVIEGTVL